jgi:hypothetical protein
MSSQIIVSDSGRVKEAIVDARISKILALRTDSLAMTEALESIGEFYVASKYFNNFRLTPLLDLSSVKTLLKHVKIYVKT